MINEYPGASKMGNSISASAFNKYTYKVRQMSTKFNNEDAERVENQVKVKTRRKCVSGFHDYIDRTLIDSGRGSLLADSNRVFTFEDPNSEYFLLEQAMNYLKVDASDPKIKGILSRLLLPSLKKLQLPADFVLQQQGDKGTNCYLVESGKLEVILNDMALCTLESGAIFGEMSMIFGYARTAKVRITYLHLNVITPHHNLFI